MASPQHPAGVAVHHDAHHHRLGATCLELPNVFFRRFFFMSNMAHVVCRTWRRPMRCSLMGNAMFDVCRMDDGLCTGFE